MSRKHVLLALWAVLIAITMYMLFTYRITPEMLQGYFMDLGPWAALVYVVAYALRPIILFPTSIMTPLAALLFGPFLGWIYAYVGETFSATIAFFIAKYFRGSFMHASGNSHGFLAFLEKYQAKLEERGFETVLFLRLVPLFPFDFVNYACGLSRIPYRTYLVATLVGILPGLTAYIFLGSSLMNPWLLIPTAIVFVLLSLIARYMRKRH